jgi:hypothetical protein
MTKKKVSFINVNFRQGPVELNAYFLPYSSGVLWAYAKSIPEIDAAWELDLLAWKRENINQVAERLSTNHIVCFSTYIWNRHYNYELAKRIKEINPDVLILFGGPEPPVSDPDIFSKHPYIDLVAKLEGEITISRVLQEFEFKRWNSIPGLLVNQSGTPVDTGDPERITDLSILPSPYLTGLFDDIVKNNPGHSWNATIESNRGCPYQCTFCDWGSLTYNKVKLFPMEKVYAEIDWIADNADFILIADANFGMFVDRDKQIVEHIIRSQKRTGNKYVFFTNWAKNQKADVFHMISRLKSETGCVVNGLSVSVQSLTLGVLDTIKRTNLNQHKLHEIFTLSGQTGIPVYTEFILGLPGETLESWKNNLYQIFELGNHYGVDIIQCQLLENAEMNLSQRSIFKIKSKDVIDYMSQTTDTDEGPVETIAIVTETTTMPRADMLEAQVWSSFMQVCHMSSLSSQISRYLRKAHEISYKQFYEGLYDYALQDSYIKTKLESLRLNYNHWMEHGYLPHPVTNEISQTGINLITSFLLLIHLEKKVDHLHTVIESFVDKNFPMLDQQIKKSLYDYQRSMILKYDDLQDLPKTKTFEYNFHGYLDHDEELNEPAALRLDLSEKDNLSYVRFHENLYYGRKRGFGRSQIEKIKIK